jgi:hypothetical protein
MELIEVTNKFKAWDGLEQGYVEGVQMLEMPSWM